MSFCVYPCMWVWNVFGAHVARIDYGLMIFGPLAFEITLYNLCDPMLQGMKEIKESTKVSEGEENCKKKKKKKVWNVNFWCMSPILPVHHRIINSRKDGRDGQLGRTHFPICCPDRTLGSRPHETQAKLFIWICHIPCTLSFYKYLILLFSNFLLCDLFI